MKSSDDMQKVAANFCENKIVNKDKIQCATTMAP